MTVHFNDAAASTGATSSTSASPEATAEERVVTINMKHRHESEILSQLMALTTAVPVQATPEEVELMDALEKARQKSERDQAMNAAFNEAKKRKEAILAAARSGMA